MLKCPTNRNVVLSASLIFTFGLVPGAIAQKGVPAPTRDPFQPNSVWMSDDFKRKLTVLDRQAETFRARFEVGDNIEREITGTIKDGKVSWLAKNVRAIKGGPGSDNNGTISGDRIDLEYRNAKGITDTFTLRRREAAASKSDAPASSRANRQQSYVIRWDFDATKGIPTGSGELLIPVPSDEPYQKVRWELTGVRTERVVKVNEAPLVAVRPTGQTFQLRVTVEPIATEIRKPGGKVAVPSEATACLRDNAALAKRNPKTAKLAQELKADDPVQTVKNIRRWMQQNWQGLPDWRDTQKLADYQRSVLVGGVESYLETKKGNCTAYSALFVALCRQAGVPARVVWGPIKTVLTQDVKDGLKFHPLPPGLMSELKIGDHILCGHFWAEIFLEEWGWIPLDPQHHTAPLGQLPRSLDVNYVPFLRFAPDTVYARPEMQDQAAVAILNVQLMGAWVTKASPAARSADSTGKSQPSKQSRK
jgi:transglutaminase-like putative cysteine protease